MTTAAVHATVAAVLLWGAAACGTGDDAAPAAPAESAATEHDRHEPMDGVSADHDHAVVVAGAGTDPAQAATLVLTTWARPDLSYSTWWAQLEPLLDASARQAYAETDPAALPRLRVRPGARVLGKTPTWAVVAVPTSQGRFRVELTRSGVSAEAGGGWQAARLHFPAAVG